jgi:hypothetical protein
MLAMRPPKGRVTPSACITARRSLASAFRRRASDATID